jgi:pSer/pThr/pTyr-binding forkhead associated (FHA) protein
VLASQGKNVLELPLTIGRKVIGRTEDNDLQIDNRFVSRHHCQVVTTEEFSVIEDLNSTNGIYIKGKRIRRMSLNDGDIISIGNDELMYFDDRPHRWRPEADTNPNLAALDEEAAAEPQS